jgi:hypothetical protein
MVVSFDDGDTRSNAIRVIPSIKGTQQERQNGVNLLTQRVKILSRCMNPAGYSIAAD